MLAAKFNVLIVAVTFSFRRLSFIGRALAVKRWRPQKILPASRCSVPLARRSIPFPFGWSFLPEADPLKAESVTNNSSRTNHSLMFHVFPLVAQTTFGAQNAVISAPRF
ncbi:MAG: hypothetical protein KJ964_09020 [Verrucomicrobia bacterium]|nr:hypothetical protein [Verrucomicrobiota bacterium]MBU1734862.1 hypothetical protein [Verrucomicrobiota bacterium]MBU1856006.1 hypothetical protein [Verrucomicrobiota bacterium]